ncbi:hypothetical protein OH492_12215 [Vibrio chagasii]|nr:hypothetical protein [Vibrio chagasii]
MTSNNTRINDTNEAMLRRWLRNAISQEMLNRWQDEGLSTEFVLVKASSVHPGSISFQLDNVGERTFLYWRNDSAARYMVQHSDFDKIANQLR